MKRLVLFMLIAGILPGALLAGDLPKYELHTGYSYLRAAGEANLHGWEAGLTRFFTDRFGLVGTVSGHYGNSDSFYNLMAGPKYAWGRSGPVTFFVQAQAGIGSLRHTFPIVVSSQNLNRTLTQFAIAMGGGLDVKIKKNMILRPVQVEWLRQFDDLKENECRYTFGFVFRLGD